MGITEDLMKVNKELQAEVAERRRAEKRLSENMAQLFKKNRNEGIASAVTRSIHQSINLQEVLENAVEAMSKNLDSADSVSIYLVEEKELVLKAHRGYPAWYIESAGRIPYPEDAAWEAIMEGKPRYVANADEDTALVADVRELGMKSYISMPIRFKDKAVGTLNITAFKKGAFDEEDLKLLDIVAQQLEIAINNARQAEALIESEGKFRSLVEQTNDLVWEVGRDGSFTYVNPKVFEIIGYRPVEILGRTAFDFMPDEEARRFSEVIGFFISEMKPFTHLEKTLLHKNGRTVVLETSGSPVLDMHGVFVGYRGIARDITERKSSENALRESHEVLELRVRERTKKLHETNVELKKEITERRLAENALIESLSQLSKKSRYETIISTVTRSVHKSINLQDVLENAVEAINNNVDVAENVCIYLVESEEAVLKAHRSLPDWYIERASRISRPKGFTWKTIIEGKPTYCADIDQDTLIGPAGRELGTKSYLSIPIHFEGSAVGALNIHSMNKNEFDGEDIKLLEIVAQQIETAINHAKQADALRESEERYRALYEKNPSMYFTVDTKGKILSVNQFGAGQLGYKVGELIGRSVLDIFHRDDRKAVHQQLMGCLQNPSVQVARWEFRKVKKNKNILWVRESARVVRDSGGEAVVLIVCEDITERKRTEEQIKTSLKEKEVLLKEIHHRVKNNLQVISSLLDLQSEHSDDERAIKVLHETQNRLKSMALIHEQLYQSKDLAKIDFAEYIGNLGDWLFQSYGGASKALGIKTEADDILLDIDTAITCGLIMNELISNSLKHAFRDGDMGEIRIGLRSKTSSGALILTISDDGIGFPKHLNFRKTKSLGLQLVNAMTEQLKGKISLTRKRGTTFKIVFSP